MVTRSKDPLGPALRQIRHRLGLSLQQIEEKSDGDWKAVVIGSYERGDRAPSVMKARALLAWYSSSAAASTSWRLGLLNPGDVVVRAAENTAGSTEDVEWLVVYGDNHDGTISCESEAEARGIHSHWPTSAVAYRTRHLGPVTYPGSES